MDLNDCGTRRRQGRNGLRELGGCLVGNNGREAKVLAGLKHGLQQLRRLHQGRVDSILCCEQTISNSLSNQNLIHVAISIG